MEKGGKHGHRAVLNKDVPLIGLSPLSSLVLKLKIHFYSI